MPGDFAPDPRQRRKEYDDGQIPRQIPACWFRKDTAARGIGLDQHAEDDDDDDREKKRKEDCRPATEEGTRRGPELRADPAQVTHGDIPPLAIGASRPSSVSPLSVTALPVSSRYTSSRSGSVQVSDS